MRRQPCKLNKGTHLNRSRIAKYRLKWHENSTTNENETVYGCWALMLILLEFCYCPISIIWIEELRRKALLTLSWVLFLSQLWSFISFCDTFCWLLCVVMWVSNKTISCFFMFFFRLAHWLQHVRLMARCIFRFFWILHRLFKFPRWMMSNWISLYPAKYTVTRFSTNWIKGTISQLLFLQAAFFSCS